MRIKQQELRIKLIVSLLFILYSLFLFTPIQALEPTITATPSADLKLKALIEEIASRAASQAAKLKTEISRKLQNKAFVGQIKSKSTKTIILSTDKEDKTIKLNEFTKYLPKKVSLSSLEAQDFIAALGDIDDTDVLTAKQIVKLSPPKKIEKQIIYGVVLSAGDDSLTVQTKQGQNFSFTVDPNTTYKSTKNQSLDLDDIRINKPIIVVGINPKNKVMKARFIYILPYAATFKPKIASPSAQATSTKKSP